VLAAALAHLSNAMVAAGYRAFDEGCVAQIPTFWLGICLVPLVLAWLVAVMGVRLVLPDLILSGRLARLLVAGLGASLVCTLLAYLYVYSHEPAPDPMTHAQAFRYGGTLLAVTTQSVLPGFVLVAAFLTAFAGFHSGQLGRVS